MPSLASLRENLYLKAASLVLAFFFWLYVRGEERPAQVFSLPLEIEGLPADLAVAGDMMDNVAAKVRAPETTMRSLTPGRFRARVNLGGAKAGEITVPLVPEIVRAPVGVDVIQVDPPSLTLRLEPRGRRELPVVARLTGTPAAGYETRGYTVVPDRVTVDGPESRLSTVKEVVTEEMDLSGLAGDFEKRVTISPGHGGVRIEGPAVVWLKVSIGEARVTRTFPGVRLTPSLPASASFEAVVDEESVTVVLEGTRAAVDQIQEGNIAALLDLDGMSPRAVPYDVRPRVVLTPSGLGEGITVRSISRETVSVKLSHRGRRE